MHPLFPVAPHLPDPDDAMVLELAVNGRAEAIVTMNTHGFLPAARTCSVEVLRQGWSRRARRQPGAIRSRGK